MMMASKKTLFDDAVAAASDDGRLMVPFVS